MEDQPPLSLLAGTVPAERGQSPIFGEFAAFFRVLLFYFLHKAASVIGYQLSVVSKLPYAASTAKFHLVRKLIWSRGRLGQPVSHLGALSLASAVFVTGGLLSGSSFVRSQSSVSDFLPVPDILMAQVLPETEVSDYPRKEPLTYTVKGGDTLSAVGEAYHVSVDAIRYANSLADEDYLSVGQTLTIPPVEGVVYKVAMGDTVESLAKKFAVSPQAIIEFNYLFEPFTLTLGTALVIPEATIPEEPALARGQSPAGTVPERVPLEAYTEGGSAGTVSGAMGYFGWPVNFREISQYFSYYHPAIDVPGTSSVYASDGGRVTRAGWWPNGYGYAVKIDHGNGYTTTYAHLSRIDVSVGQAIAKGEVIGVTGNTGRSWGTHLHFVIQQGGRYLNPLSLL